MVLFLLSKTEYLLENMEASVKDSAVLSRQEPEKLQQASLKLGAKNCACLIDPMFAGCVS